MDNQSILELITNNFDITLIISINALVYGIIKIATYFNKKEIFKSIKIFITIFSSIIMGLIFHKFSEINTITIINSCICAPLIWDWIIKPIFKKVKIE